MSEKMPSKRRSYTREFQMKVLREVEAGKSQAQAAREYQLGESSIYKSRRQFAKYKSKAFVGRSQAYTDAARISELERKVGQLTMENDFLKKLLQKLADES